MCLYSQQIINTSSKIGDFLLKNDDRDVAALKSRVQDSWLLLPCIAQLAESKVKGTSFCKAISKSEYSASSISMIRSLTKPQETSAIKENAVFKNRKRRSEGTNDCLYNK